MEMLAFTFLPILEGDIVNISNYDHDKYLSISAWVKPGGHVMLNLK